MQPIKPFEEQETYDSELRHLIDEIKRICEMRRIPFVMSFQIEQGKDNLPTLRNTIRLFDGRTDRLMACLGLMASRVDMLQTVTESIEETTGQFFSSKVEGNPTTTVFGYDKNGKII